MAQKTGNEESEFKSLPEALPLCINTCAVNPTPATIKSPTRTSPEIRLKIKVSDAKPAVKIAKKEVNRCFGCRKKVGLTGFRCRCGELFCADHRYSDRHDCSFDYKSVGREMIARENPVVKAAKIVRI